VALQKEFNGDICLRLKQEATIGGICFMTVILALGIDFQILIILNLRLKKKPRHGRGFLIKDLISLF